MYTLYFEINNIKLKLVGTSDCIYEIKFVQELEQNNSCLYLEEVRDQISSYLMGNNAKLDFNYAITTTSFKTEVYNNLIDTEVGEFISYKQLGDKFNSKAYQAIGSAMRTNKLPIIIPCHRVIQNNRMLGNFAGGIEVKEYLFYLESEYAMEQKVWKDVHFTSDEINFINTHPILSKIDNKQTSYQMYNDPFICLISQVIYQLISYTSATKMELRLYNYFNYKITPIDILNLIKKEAQMINLPLNKLEYMKNIATYYLENIEFFEYIESKSSEEIFRTLKTIRGVGRWTVEMFLIFGLGRKGVFSFDDLILLNCYKHLYDVEIVSNVEKKAFLEDIKGNETIVAINMWHFLEKLNKTEV